MASRQSRKIVQVRAHDDSEEAEQQSSHDQNTIDVLKTAQDMVSSSKRRREAKRKTIEAEHEKKTKDVAAKINTLFETRKNRVIKSQKAQWDRLDTLNKKRSSLEALILASMRSIEQHSANISNEMGAMFGGRIGDIQENSASQAAKDLAVRGLEIARQHPIPD